MTNQPATFPPGDFLIWLLTRFSSGEKLTATGALNRQLVRDAVELRPEWWHTDLFGPPYREAEIGPLEVVHEHLLSQKLIRRYKGKIWLSTPGKDALSEALRDPSLEGNQRLAARCISALFVHGDFESFVAKVVCELCVTHRSIDRLKLNDIILQIVTEMGWTASGGPIDHGDLFWPVMNTVSLLEALDVVYWPRNVPRSHDIKIGEAARAVLVEALVG